MTLYQMSGIYRADAERLRGEIALLRARRAQMSERERIREIDARIASLTVLLLQSSELAALTEHYYDEGYHRSEKYTL